MLMCCGNKLDFALLAGTLPLIWAHAEALNIRAIKRPTYLVRWRMRRKDDLHLRKRTRELLDPGNVSSHCRGPKVTPIASALRHTTRQA
jgi:hypothetical protein